MPKTQSGVNGVIKSNQKSEKNGNLGKAMLEALAKAEENQQKGQ